MTYQFSTISACPICRKNPLLFTDFHRPWAAFCTDCKLWIGKNHLKRITVTDELKTKLQENWDIFLTAKKDYVNPEWRFKECTKCQGLRGTAFFHVSHLMPKEKERHDNAKKILGL